jgi:hypothetical protein
MSLPLLLALGSLLATASTGAPLARIDAPASEADIGTFEATTMEVDADEGMGSALALVPSFDLATRTGSLVSVGEAEGGEVVMQRPGEAVLRVHELEAEGTQVVLVLWRSLEEPGVLHPELWSAEGSPLWGTLPRVTWRDARVEVRHKDGAAVLMVTRSLTDENEVAPLRKRERYRVNPGGLLADAHRYAKAEGPEQTLNLIADLGNRGQWAAMVQQVKRLPRKEARFLQRAAIILSRFPAGPAARGKSRLLLETMAAHSSKQDIVVAAADRLLEMAWEDTATKEGLAE